MKYKNMRFLDDSFKVDYSYIHAILNLFYSCYNFKYDNHCFS